MNYFLELRNRFTLIIITLFSIFFTSYFYKEVLLFLFFEPEVLTNYFIFTEVSEVFSVYIELCMLFSFHLTLLMCIYHIFAFVSFGLFKSEYYMVRYILLGLSSSWFLSLLLSKLFLIPLILKFYFNFKSTSFFDFYFEAGLLKYFNFYKEHYNLFAFYSQFLIIIIVCFNYLNQQLRSITKYRKLVHYIILLIATLVTPPDLISQFVLSLTFISFYELFFLLLVLRSVAKP
jgi:sec-independent protein translocase protein TatC